MKNLFKTETAKDHFNLMTFENDIQHKGELQKWNNLKKEYRKSFKLYNGGLAPSYAEIYDNLEDKFSSEEFKQKLMDRADYKLYYDFCISNINLFSANAELDKLYFEAVDLGYAFYGFVAEQLIIDLINEKGQQLGLSATKATVDEDISSGIDFKVKMVGYEKELKIQLKSVGYILSLGNSANSAVSTNKKLENAENAYYLFYDKAKEGIVAPLRGKSLLHSSFALTHSLTKEDYVDLEHFMIELVEELKNVNPIEIDEELIMRELAEIMNFSNKKNT